MSTTNTPFFVPLFKNGYEYHWLQQNLKELPTIFRHWLRGKALQASHQIFDWHAFRVDFEASRQRLLQQLEVINIQNQRAMDEDLQALIP